MLVADSVGSLMLELPHWTTVSLMFDDEEPTTKMVAWIIVDHIDEFSTNGRQNMLYDDRHSTRQRCTKGDGKYWFFGFSEHTFAEALEEAIDRYHFWIPKDFENEGMI
jgi:hypothetical protein